MPDVTTSVVPAPIPAPFPGSDTGLGDGSWISLVRDALRDYPKFATETWTADGTNGTVGSNAVPLTVAKPPVNDGSMTIFNSTTSTTYTVITSGTPTASQVLVSYDTGELEWLTAPTTGNVINYSYQTCKWRNRTIMDGLYAGLRALFPRIGKTYVDTSTQIQVNQWDYMLPIWAQDPRSRVIGMEIADPYIPTEPFRPAPPGGTRIGLTQLHLPWSQKFSPIARVRLTGWGPYLALSDLEPQLFHLPVWYALGVLLPKQESKRIREDNMVPLTQEGGQTPGLLMQTGDYFARRFEQEVDRLARVMGPGYNMPIATVYQRARHTW